MAEQWNVRNIEHGTETVNSSLENDFAHRMVNEIQPVLDPIVTYLDTLEEANGTYLRSLESDLASKEAEYAKTYQNLKKVVTKRKADRIFTVSQGYKTTMRPILQMNERREMEEEYVEEVQPVLKLQITTKRQSREVLEEDSVVRRKLYIIEKNRKRLQALISQKSTFLNTVKNENKTFCAFLCELVAYCEKHACQTVNNDRFDLLKRRLHNLGKWTAIETRVTQESLMDRLREMQHFHLIGPEMKALTD